MHLPLAFVLGVRKSQSLFRRYREGIEDPQMGEPHKTQRSVFVSAVSQELFDHLCEKTFLAGWRVELRMCEASIRAHKAGLLLEHMRACDQNTPERGREALCTCLPGYTHTHSQLSSPHTQTPSNATQHTHYPPVLKSRQSTGSGTARESAQG